MPNLIKLSIQNCTSLTDAINLFLNTNLLTLDMSGTNLNVILPTGSKVTTLEYGTPTQVSILGPTQLAPTGLKVDSIVNLESLTISNMPNNKTFAAFAKIFNI